MNEIKPKPGDRRYEIHWSRKHEQFEILDTEDPEPGFTLITTEQARKHWDACDSDWSMGAFELMAEHVMQKGVS